MAAWGLQSRSCRSKCPARRPSARTHPAIVLNQKSSADPYPSAPVPIPLALKSSRQTERSTPHLTGTTGRRPRLAIFASHPIQYQAPLFRSLAARGDLDPVVFFGSRQGLDLSLDKGFGVRLRWDIPLLDGYEHEFLENRAKTPDVESFVGIRLSEPGEVLRRGSFDACLVLGWQTLGHVQMIRAAWSAGIPVILRGESNLQRRPLPGLRSRLRAALWLPVRERLYAAAFRRVARFAVIGSRNAAFYRHFGVPDEKMVWAPYGVANEHFALPDDARAAARDLRRAELRCSASTVLFASVAKLVPFKRPFDLLESFAACVASGVDAKLVYVGDGPLRASLEAAIAERGLQDRVAITGFANQSAIPEWYAAADCLVLPSDFLETWGLVVNEAMAAGLPVIVSDAAGCSDDLVREGVNGFRFRAGDTGQLGGLLRRVADAGPEERARMGERSRELIAGFTIDRAAAAIAEAVSAITGRGVSDRS